jgi:mRNA-degrading endonuclease HigB of HigAB toxin-antitoxin module
MKCDFQLLNTMFQDDNKHIFQKSGDELKLVTHCGSLYGNTKIKKRRLY